MIIIICGGVTLMWVVMVILCNFSYDFDVGLVVDVEFTVILCNFWWWWCGSDDIFDYSCWILGWFFSIFVVTIVDLIVSDKICGGYFNFGGKIHMRWYGGNGTGFMAALMEHSEEDVIE